VPKGIDEGHGSTLQKSARTRLVERSRTVDHEHDIDEAACRLTHGAEADGADVKDTHEVGGSSRIAHDIDVDSFGRGRRESHGGVGNRPHAHPIVWQVRVKPSRRGICGGGLLRCQIQGFTHAAGGCECGAIDGRLQPRFNRKKRSGIDRQPHNWNQHGEQHHPNQQSNDALFASSLSKNFQLHVSLFNRSIENIRRCPRCSRACSRQASGSKPPR
jgi:hypothetical protein